MKYHKLVRDKIPEYLKSKNYKVSFHIASDEEYWEKLKEKLLEEANEFCDNETLEEMADIQEVLEAIKSYKHFSQKDLDLARKKKFTEKGSFEKRIILEETR